MTQKRLRQAKLETFAINHTLTPEEIQEDFDFILSLKKNTQNRRLPKTAKRKRNTSPEGGSGASPQPTRRPDDMPPKTEA